MVKFYKIRFRLANLKCILPFYVHRHKEYTCELFGVICHSCSFLERGESCVIDV